MTTLKLTTKKRTIPMYDDDRPVAMPADDHAGNAATQNMNRRLSSIFQEVEAAAEAFNNAFEAAVQAETQLAQIEETVTQMYRQVQTAKQARSRLASVKREAAIRSGRYQPPVRY